jgi:hypothetical protein
MPIDGTRVLKLIEFRMGHNAAQVDKHNYYVYGTWGNETFNFNSSTTGLTDLLDGVQMRLFATRC